MERNFQGIWISKEIWLSENLTLQEKVFYVEIQSLDNENGCFANNEYFSKFFGISKVRVSEVINSLIKKGYIESILNKGLGNKRILKTLLKKSLIPSQTKVEDPIKEKFKHNNINNNITNNIIKDISLEKMQEFKNNDLTNTLYKIFMLDNFKQSIDIEKFKEIYQYFIEENSHKGLYFRDGEGNIRADGMIILVKKMLNYYEQPGKEIKNIKSCLLTFLKK